MGMWHSIQLIIMNDKGSSYQSWYLERLAWDLKSRMALIMSTFWRNRKTKYIVYSVSMWFRSIVHVSNFTALIRSEWELYIIAANLQKGSKLPHFVATMGNGARGAMTQLTCTHLYVTNSVYIIKF